MLCLICSLLALLGGCRRAADGVARFAENTRTATEQLGSTSDQENERRGRTIASLVAGTPDATPLRLVERYETRQGPDGLFIYDTETHAVARLANQPQAGLTLDQASKAVDTLSAADAKGESH